MSDIAANKLLLVIIAILIPAPGRGSEGGDRRPLIINIVLTLLFYLPGLLHALYVILK